MFSKLHERFGTAGLVVAVIALVAAVGGTAIAAGGLTKQQEKQVTKIAKKYAGKKGAKGAPGAPGAPGPAGAKGDKGDTGSAGTNGTNGSDGTDGTDGITGPTGPTGKNVTGPTGPTGGFAEPLPNTATKTGVWAIPAQQIVPADSTQYVSINWLIPLSAKLTGDKMHYVNPSGKEVVAEGFLPKEIDPINCLGTAAAPTAPSGHLCVYGSFEQGIVPLMDAWFVDVGSGNPNIPVGSASSSLTGAILSIAIPGNSSGKALGTWAVTG